MLWTRRKDYFEGVLMGFRAICQIEIAPLSIRPNSKSQDSCQEFNYYYLC